MMTNAAGPSSSTPPFKTGFQANRTTSSAKEPKFVPYEPYKAAVTSILPPPPKHKKTRLAKVENAYQGAKRQNTVPLYLVKLRNRALKFLVHFSLVCLAKYPKPHEK